MSDLDPRHLLAGRIIPGSVGYADQPFVVHTADGGWLLVMTTAAGVEGSKSQHVISLRTMDEGRSWEPPIRIEEPFPESSYAVPAVMPGGRVYVFYTHNTDDLRRIAAADSAHRDSHTKDGWCDRVDTQGHFVFRFSDDHGRTWSSTRHRVPVRAMAVDRENIYGGKVRFFWTTGRPMVEPDGVYVPLYKVGEFGHGFMRKTEGVLLYCPNLAAEADPDKLEWITLPEGDHGIKVPRDVSIISEEHSFVPLSDGTFYCVFRTVTGHPYHALSRDRGRTWSTPAPVQHAHGGLVKHPRAANFIWRLSSGRFLYWIHHHGGQWYDRRNPAWLCSGVETDGLHGRTIAWSDPEIFLYHEDAKMRFSYPDLVETSGGAIYVTETNKTEARIHRIDDNLQRALLRPNEFPPWPGDARTFVFSGNSCETIATDLGLSIIIDLNAAWNASEWSFMVGQPGRDVQLKMRKIPDGALQVEITADSKRCVHTTRSGLITANARRLIVIIDARPRLGLIVLDGIFENGADAREQGWWRLDEDLPWRPLHACRHGGAPECDAVSFVPRSLTVAEAIAICGGMPAPIGQNQVDTPILG